MFNQNPGFGVPMGGGMPMMGGGMPMFGNPMNMMNPQMMMGGNWMNIYSSVNNNMNNMNSNQIPNLSGQKKINVIFQTTMGVKTNVLIDYGKTVSELFQIYLKKVDKFELYNTENTVYFLFNANKVKMTEPTKVEDFFKITPNPTIVVNDVKGLIGALLLIY